MPLLEAIGATLPAALAVALSPFPVIGIVLILAGPGGRRNGALFALGWVAGLILVAALVVVVFSGADDPDTTPSTVADWFQILVGAGLILAAVRKWLKRSDVSGEVSTPGWMASLEEATPGKALLLGALLSGANPKNFVLTATAAASIAEAGAHGADLVVAAGVFVLLGSLTVLGAVVVHMVGGARGVAFLDGVRTFMVANASVITIIVMLVLGAKVLGDGLG